MGCEFTEINQACYYRKPMGVTGDVYFDLFKDKDSQAVNGFGFVDPYDLYIPPGEKEPRPVQPEIPFREDPQGRFLSLGHFFGRPIETLHHSYYNAYFGAYQSADLLAVVPRNIPQAEIAFLSNDLFNVYIYPGAKLPHWEKRITDDLPQLPALLKRVENIAIGKLRPPRVYKKDVEQVEYENRNKEKALELLHFYWRLGSDGAGRILDSPQFKELLEKYPIKHPPRFDQVTRNSEGNRRAVFVPPPKNPPPFR